MKQFYHIWLENKMFVKMKDELIALYYQLSECCNKIGHKSLERILIAKISNN